MQQIRPEVRACYKSLLGDFPDAGGQVTVSIRIVPEDRGGRVDRAKLVGDKTSLYADRFHDCLLTNVADIDVPEIEPDAGVGVTMPFNFVRDRE